MHIPMSSTDLMAIHYQRFTGLYLAITRIGLCFNSETLLRFPLPLIFHRSIIRYIRWFASCLCLLFCYRIMTLRFNLTILFKFFPKSFSNLLL